MKAQATFIKGYLPNESGRDNQKQSKIEVTYRSSYEQDKQANIDSGTQRQ